MQFDSHSDILSEPDAILMRESKAVHEYVVLFTIPLVFFKEKIDRGGVIGTGSAVLVKDILPLQRVTV